jgi:hypothetical protein
LAAYLRPQHIERRRSGRGFFFVLLMSTLFDYPVFVIPMSRTKTSVMWQVFTDVLVRAS